jgi:hypothetical protein
MHHDAQEQSGRSGGCDGITELVRNEEPSRPVTALAQSRIRLSVGSAEIGVEDLTRRRVFENFGIRHAQGFAC